VQDTGELAIEAVRSRRAGSPLYRVFLQEIEASGLSPNRIRELLERAEATLADEIQPDDPRVRFVERPRTRMGLVRT
jgi:hypothetical protein